MTRLALVLVSLLALSCSPVSKQALTKRIRSIESTLHNHAGFMVYDLEKKKEVYAYQSHQYFIPASNTKILTLYTALSILRDSIPALKYREQNDSLIFWGTGDPSFLYEKTHNSGSVLEFLQRSEKKLFLGDLPLYATPLGPGWSWDDYNFAYSAERSAFPIFGNIFSVTHTGQSLNIYPSYFSYQVTISDSIEKADVTRDIGSNKVVFSPGNGITPKIKWRIPFKTSSQVTAELLSDTLEKEVTVLNTFKQDSLKTLYSVPADSLYKTMMQESDNFIAEQLLLVCAGVLGDSLKPEIAMKYMEQHHFTDLPDAPVWVDGSGLSRFNLNTPRNIVKLWEKLYQGVARDRLFSLLAIGGKTGTIKNWYKNDPPYIYGKTGTLTNNHSLSGYLITRKGRTLIFSFMSNNHPTSVRVVRAEMEQLVKSLYEHY